MNKNDALPAQSVDIIEIDRTIHLHATLEDGRTVCMAFTLAGARKFAMDILQRVAILEVTVRK